MCMDTRVRLPLDCRAGSTERRAEAQGLPHRVHPSTAPRKQMYSLNTAVMWSVADIIGQDRWEFVSVKRPSGAEVMFSLYGPNAARPG